MTLLKWRSKLTCDGAAPVGGAGRRPANFCHSPVRLDSGKAAIREQDRLLFSPSLLFMIFHS
jgi:hypothetical protein